VKKLINAPETVLAESLDGFALAHADLVELGEGRKFVRRKQSTPGKVALISGGGSGHEPLHAGFVGRGMLDAACPGQIFTSPTPDQIVAAMQSVDSGAGSVLIVKNYEGDVMNFDMAAEMAEGNVRTVIVDDDVAVGDALAFLLVTYGYDAVTVRNVAEARARLDRQAFAALITDLTLPEGGRRWLAELRARRPLLPVLVVTGAAIDAAGLERLHSLADAVLPKPVESQVLVAMLDRVIQRRSSTP
jgi:CheY-like chemotaxis protein